MSDSDYESELHLTARELKELERKRQKNKKKRESKKANKKGKGDNSSVAPIDEFEDASEAAVINTAIEKPDTETAGEGEDVKDIDIVTSAQTEAGKGKTNAGSGQLGASVEIEYVGETPKLDASDPNFHYFSKIFEAFKVKSEEELAREGVSKLPKPERREVVVEDTSNKAAISEQILQEEMRQRRKEAEESGEAQKMSRKKLRLAMQPSIAELKAITPHPEVVEWADVTSRDPFLLVELKSYRNTVPVPRHWNAKRKYLAGKRGFERPPFELPEFIKRTGIMEMRESMWEKEDAQSMKGKMRERARPKLGRIDIDYQKLHDAFFKWQNKPAMTKMGELYYEGKEMEAQMKEKKPGMLSDELRIALGMPVGPNCTKFPPPWLIAMQRYGPPPSYPNLRIPGLNAPIPEGCAFGYHAGGWGKPPVDEYGKPLYGDVFGVELGAGNDLEDESKIDRRHWGEIASDEEEESEDESEPDEGGDEEGAEAASVPPESGFATPATEGFTTPSGFTSVPGGLETPASIELRKEKGASDASLAGADTPRELYSVLPEKRVDRIAGQYMGSSHVYDVSGQRKMPAPSDGVEVSLNPEELDFSDPKGLERKYEEQLRKQNKLRQDNEEDFSDLVAEHSAKQNRKRKAQHDQKSSSASSDKKKYKDFKF